MKQKRKSFARSIATSNNHTKRAKLMKLSEYLLWLLPFSGDGDWDMYWFKGTVDLMLAARKTKKRYLNQKIKMVQATLEDIKNDIKQDPLALNLVDPETLDEFGKHRMNKEYLDKKIEELQFDRKKLTPFNLEYYILMQNIFLDANRAAHPEEATPYTE